MIAQNLSTDYTFSSFSSTTSGSLDGNIISMSSPSGTEQNTIVNWSSSGILPSGFSNLPTRSANALKESSSTYNSKVVTFTSDLSVGNIILIEDIDINEDIKITLKNQSGTIINPNAGIAIHLPISNAPTVTTTTTDITFVGTGSNASDPIIILECTVGNIRSIEFEFRRLTSSNFGFYFAKSNIPLSVELVNFNASSLGNETIMLNWQTATELNNNYFIIERSQDGKIWEEIGMVEGNETTLESTNYEFIDRQPLFAANYYRLKQIDFDGQFEYSDVKIVQRKSPRKEVLVFPNPAAEKIHITNLDANTNLGDLMIMDITGKVVSSSTKISRSNDNRYQIDISLLSSGFYLVKTPREAYKFIKQ